MTIAERAEAYARTFPTRPPLQIVQEGGADVIYGTWVCGADYRTRSTLYGAYPHGYLPRVLALFPDAGDEVLHAFSGALEPGPYTRLDLIDRCRVPDLRFRQASVYDAATVFEGRRPFNVVIADPPYSKADAAMYGTPTLHRGRATRALAPVTRVGGHLVWLTRCGRCTARPTGAPSAASPSCGPRTIGYGWSRSSSACPRDARGAADALPTVRRPALRGLGDVRAHLGAAD